MTRTQFAIVAMTTCMTLLPPPSLGAQERPGVMGELLRDVETVESKILGLARTMPATAYEWRPGKGIRSAGEVFAHVAGDNYFLPALIGTPAPVETGIDGKDNKTVAQFEARPWTRDRIIAELETSFAFLKSAMADTPESAVELPAKNSTRKRTTRAVWIATVSHLHEHLGQLIAYARSNGVTPPWSK